MKTKSFQAGFALGLLLITICSFSDRSFAQTDNSEEIAKLREQINKLETKVDEQSETIARLQKELSELKSRRPLLAIPKLGDKNSLPKGSREFYFNGHVYYIVPLDNKTKSIQDKETE